MNEEGKSFNSKIRKVVGTVISPVSELQSERQQLDKSPVIVFKKGTWPIRGEQGHHTPGLLLSV